ncbi:MAG TPA: transposase family protein [Gemmataceae bacterium]|nr:transposase family protein [Gemmataceae bacterium]
MATPAFSILCCFCCLRPPRLDRCNRPPLLDLLVVALCAIIAGADNWQQIEAFGRKRLDELVRTLAGKGVAKRAGRTLQAVWSRRRGLQR